MLGGISSRGYNRQLERNRHHLPHHPVSGLSIAHLRMSYRHTDLRYEGFLTAAEIYSDAPVSTFDLIDAYPAEPSSEQGRCAAQRVLHSKERP